MIRFVDLRKADIVGGRFAFFDTVPNRFVEVMGSQVWENLHDFQSDGQGGGMSDHDVARCLGLMPAWAKKGGK